MEAYREEALKAQQIAERRFAEKDFLGARSYALRARSLYPELEGLSQMVMTYEVYLASSQSQNSSTSSRGRGRSGGEMDYYAVLGLKPSAGKREVKKQYKKMAVMLHPDKNKCLGASGAFHIITEAWSYLSNEFKKSSFYYQRKKLIDVQKSSNSATPQAASSERLDTFWTVCTSCKVQYEYLRKYVNKRLSCKNCRGAFIAVETGPAPLTAASVQYPSSFNNHNHNNNNNSNGGYFIGHHHHGYEYEWSSYVGTTSPPPYKLVSNGRKKVKQDTTTTSSSNSKRTTTTTTTTTDVIIPRTSSPIRKSIPESNLEPRRWSAAATGLGLGLGFDTRKLLVTKAKTDIQQRLEMMRLAAAAATATPARAPAAEDVTPLDAIINVKKINGPITVPDSDFHDFDKNRSEECFEARQIWAIYDEDDGMPRLYCVVREVLSVKPFKIDIAYLSSKTDIEFGTMKWVQYGFTKSCGHFRIRSTDIVDHVNIFSHLLKDKKTGRGGCVRIFPKTGEIWAVYKNWSPNWNNLTADQVRHQYEMVEVLDEYSEQFGVCISPLIKLDGYKTVYCRRDNEDAAKKWIPRREMLRFSHQVPSWFLKQDTNGGLPRNSWDLDPAAIPEQLLHSTH